MAAPAFEPTHKVCLICIDGWGVSKGGEGDAIAAAATPVMDGFAAGEEGALYAELAASGLAVGLPAGVMGNSEVGHLTIGSGRRSYQDLVKINLVVDEGRMGENEVLAAAFNKAKEGTGRVHFAGLLSDAGVHAHINHLFAMIRAAKAAGVPSVFVHPFSDGRDTPPTSGRGYLRQLSEFLAAEEYGSIATVGGRYYGMDRDKRWDRVKLAWDTFVHGAGEKSDDLDATIAARYEAGETDEFIKPFVVDSDGIMADGDTVIFYDFRADRMREIVEVLGFGHTGASKDGSSPLPFEMDGDVPKLNMVQMTSYSADFPFPVLFPPVSMDNVLGEVISSKGLTQFHTAETEKYAHVTYFFNGGVEVQFEGESRALLESPKVATYDLQPKMAVEGVGESVIAAVKGGEYDFVMCNLAPPDMVGHTGKLEETITACAATDVVIGDIYAACKEAGFVLVITADHGNAEIMLTDEGAPVTSHTTEPVPLIVAGDYGDFSLDRSAGELADVAPTILALMGIDVPEEMTGKSVLA
eukprot:PLAT13743.1.p1 GENE.PLAT13743.1~~PLAT13743.1.p1  ORF type:complete len:561 (+),score=201.95 PLAT13743.1:108-1685(+)